MLLSPDITDDLHCFVGTRAAGRQGVVDAWTNDVVLQIIAERGSQLVSYADVRSGRLRWSAARQDLQNR